MVVVRGEPGLEAQAEAAARVFERHLAARGEALVRREASAPEDAAAALARIEARFYALETEAAAAEAGAFVEGFEQGRFGDAPREPLVGALLVRIQAELALGRDDEADLAIDRLLAIDPTPRLDPARVPPNVRARIGGRAARVGHATLRIDDAEGARVSLDGRAADATARVTIGRHVLHLSARGFAPVHLAVDVGPEGLRVPFERRRTPGSIAAIAGSPGRPLPAEAQRALADEAWTPLVLDLVREGERIVYRWSAPGEGEVFERRLEADADVSVALGASIDGSLHAREDQLRTRRRRRRIAIATSVVGAAALGTGLGLGLRVRPPESWQGHGTIEGAP